MVRTDHRCVLCGFRPRAQRSAKVSLVSNETGKRKPGGTVWMVEPQEPIRRRVALKIIKLGMDTREVIARFEAEPKSRFSSQ